MPAAAIARFDADAPRKDTTKLVVTRTNQANLATSGHAGPHR
jgi:hypothetical protein